MCGGSKLDVRRLQLAVENHMVVVFLVIGENEIGLIEIVRRIVAF